MSKTLGKVFAVAAVVVAVAAAIPTGGGSFLLAASIAAPVSAGLAVLSLVNAELLAAKARDSLQARQASVTSLQLGEVAREMIIGEALTGGSLVDAFNYGGPSGTDWEVLVVAVADHECDSLTGFYVNDTYVAFAGDGAVTGYNGQLEVYWRPGTLTDSVPAILTANGPGWTANDKGAGVAKVVVAYRADAADAKNPIWAAGRPSFAWLVKGKKCYQARLDSSVGGSGAHRWSDPSTWAWTDNLIDCRYNWVRGVYAGNQVDQPGMLLVGRGLTDVEAPPANVFAPANVCDETVSIDAGGTEKRYRVNGVIRADEAFIDIEEHFAAACSGVIHQPEGAVEIEPGQAKAPVFFFSDDDLVVGTTVEWAEDLPETDESWVNTVLPRYIEPAQKYAEHAAPIRRVTADVVADGGPREQALSLAFVTSSTQGGRCGEIVRRLGRLWGRGRLTLPPSFAEVEEGDWGVWTSQRYLKGASVTVRVETYGLDEKWRNTLVLREISADCYARDADGASNTVAVKQAVPSIGAPGAGAFALAAGALAGSGDSVPALIVTGATDNSFAELVRFEYLPSAGVVDPSTAAGWREDGTAGPDVKRREIAVAPNTGYYVGISYIVGRVPGPRRILGPVTTGSVLTAQAAAKSATFNQSTAPTADQSVENDTWQDTANGNLEYRRLAGSGRLAIGGNRIVVGGIALVVRPWALANDTRIDASATKLSGIEDGADVTASAQVAIDGPATIVVPASAAGVPTQATTNHVFKRLLGTTDVSATTTWSIASSTGCTVGVSVGVVTRSGTLAPSAGGKFTLRTLRDGVTRDLAVTFVRDDAPPSYSTGGGGGNPGTSGSGNVSSTSSSTSYGATGTESAFTCVAGTAGQVALSANVFGSIDRSSGGATSQYLYGKWQWRLAGGTWADVTTEAQSDFQAYFTSPGDVSGCTIAAAPTKTGLTSGSTYEFRFLCRCGAATSGVTGYFSGTVGGTGS